MLEDLDGEENMLATIEYDFDDDEFYWICPVCGCDNDELDTECYDCGWELPDESYGELVYGL